MAKSEVPRLNGIVTKFERGFGFIAGGDGSSYFVHHTEIQNKGLRSLTAGQQVSFSTAPGKDGRPKAVNVRVLDTTTPQTRSTSSTHQLSPLRADVVAAGRSGAAATSCHLGLHYYRRVDAWTMKDGRWHLGGQAKTEFLKQVIALNEALRTGSGAGLLTHTHCRQDRALASLSDRGWAVGTISLRTSWRFVTGLGIRHPFETGLGISHTIGVPFLPASSVKGAAGAWAKEAGDAAKGSIFGSAIRAGRALFFDAFPVSWPKLEIDIINPHYGDYYQGSKPPADWLSPNPVHFLAVAPSQAFKFAVAVRPSTKDDDTDADSVLKAVLEIVQSAAKGAGLGGKTSVGYGFFS